MEETDGNQTRVSVDTDETQYTDEDRKRNYQRSLSQTGLRGDEGGRLEQIELNKVGEGGVKPIPAPRTNIRPMSGGEVPNLNERLTSIRSDPYFDQESVDPAEWADKMGLSKVVGEYERDRAIFLDMYPRAQLDKILTGFTRDRYKFAVRISPEIIKRSVFKQLFNEDGSLSSGISGTMKRFLGPTKWEIAREEELTRLRGRTKQQEEDNAELVERLKQQGEEITRLMERVGRQEEERLTKMRDGKDPGPYESIPLAEFREPAPVQGADEKVTVYSQGTQTPAGKSADPVPVAVNHTGLKSLSDEAKISIFQEIRDIFPNSKLISFNAFRRDKGRIWLFPDGDGAQVAKPMLVDGLPNKQLDPRILEDLGMTVDEITAELAARREEVDKEIDRATDKMLRQDAAEGIREHLEALNREADTIEREQEDVDKRLSLRERLRQLFKRHGVTIFSLVTAVGIVLGTVLSAMGKGLGAVAKGTAKALGELAKKLAVALPGILGTLVSTIFRAASSVVGFLAEHVWLLIAGLAVLFIEWLRSKGKRRRS